MDAPTKNTDTWQDLNAVTVNVLKLIAGGYSMAQAAPLLRMSLEQVTYAIRSGLKRWQLTSRNGLMHRAIERRTIALDLHPPVEPRRDLQPLEMLVLRQAAEDRSHKRIARLLGRTESAVKKVVSGILYALQAKHLAHAIYRAHQLDLFNPAKAAPASTGPAWRPLPRTVVEIVGLVAAGRTNKEIAAALGVTPDNVKDRLRQAHEMWRTRNRAHLVHLAHERGVLRRGNTDGR